MGPSVVAAEKLGATSPNRNAIQCLSLIDIISEYFPYFPAFATARQGGVFEPAQPAPRFYCSFSSGELKHMATRLLMAYYGFTNAFTGTLPETTTWRIQLDESSASTYAHNLLEVEPEILASSRCEN
jgi:hypothetical protein